MTDPIISTRHLSKFYGSGETVVRALNDVTIDVLPGEFLAVMGPSGCGKSTLLNMLGALDQPSEGEVWVAGENLAHLKNVDTFRARTVGFVFQLHNLLPTLTAQENVAVPMQGQKISRSERNKRAVYLLEMVGLGDRGGHLPSQLSGGQRQRVAIARSLANEPVLILADEPTGALDSQSGEELLALLGDLNQSQGTTIVVVTHDRRVAQATGRILRMRDGQVVDDHRVADPLEEDLRMLANSQLGQRLLDNNDSETLVSTNSTSTPDTLLSATEREVLRRLLTRFDDVPGKEPPAEIGDLLELLGENSR